MSAPTIPEAAIEAAWLASLGNDVSRADLTRIIEAAAVAMAESDERAEWEMRAVAWDQGAEVGIATRWTRRELANPYRPAP